MTTQKTEDGYPSEPVVNRGELPDPFVPPGGRRIKTPEEWPACSRAWRDMVVEMEYGGLPPAPDGIEAENLCHSSARGLPGGPNLWSYRVHCHGGERSFSFYVRILFPREGGGSRPSSTGTGAGGMYRTTLPDGWWRTAAPW